MRSDRRRRGSAGRRALSLLLVLMATLVALQIVTRPAPTPILATVPLHLDPAAAVDVVLDGRAGRLLVVNAGLAQAFDTRTGVRVYATRTGTAYAQGIESPPPVVDERSGRVYVPNLVDDAVYVFDGRSGRPLPPLRVGHRPDLLALDDRRGRLLVASTADWTLTVLDARTGVRCTPAPWTWAIVPVNSSQTAGAGTPSSRGMAGSSQPSPAAPAIWCAAWRPTPPTMSRCWRWTRVRGACWASSRRARTWWSSIRARERRCAPSP